MIEPTVEAAADIIGDALDAIREVIVDAPAELLNWRPAGADTNPIAVLAVHALGSTRWWVTLSLTGVAPERDRPAEFRTNVAGAEDLLSMIDPVAADCRQLLAPGASFDPGAARTDPRDGTAVSAGWALLHAVAHLQEHVAHLELTRQVWDAARPAAEKE